MESPLIRLFRAHPRLAATCTGLTVVLVLYLTLEVVCAVKLSSRTTARYLNRDAWVGNRDYGFDTAPNMDVREVGFLGDKKIFEATYTSDALARRVTPVEPGERHHFAVVLGASFVFGQGCDNNQTLPYYIGSLAPDYKPYNYGCMAHSVSQVLRKIQLRDLRSEISEHSGVFIYVFIADHIRWNYGYIKHLWSWDYPDYRLNEEGLAYAGTMIKTRPFSYLFRPLLLRSPTVRFFNIGAPPPPSDSDYALNTEMLAALGRLTKDAFPESEFYVLLHPLIFRDRYDRGQEPVFDEMERRLRARGVNVLRYGDEMYKKDQAGGHLAYDDGHPRPRLHEITARRLVLDLGLSKTLQGQVPMVVKDARRLGG